jgi:S-adenosylmethionine:tRNA ribosyltransferase-isomerase
VASPTAGLHFTRGLLNQLKREGKEIQKVTLHINHATFKPVEEEDIRNHKMFEEEYAMSPSVWENIQKGKEGGRKIIAVGTTSTRVLETVASNGQLKGNTNIFIYPGYCFKMADALITNFHLPCSTLLMLVYAFGGVKFMRQAYQEAIDLKYRFYSYGDAMLIL